MFSECHQKYIKKRGIGFSYTPIGLQYVGRFIDNLTMDGPLLNKLCVRLFLESPIYIYIYIRHSFLQVLISKHAALASQPVGQLAG